MNQNNESTSMLEKPQMIINDSNGLGFVDKDMPGAENINQNPVIVQTVDNDTNDKLKSELAAIKNERKEVKKKFDDSNNQFDQFLKQVNELQTEQQLLSEVIRFKEKEKRKVDDNNLKTKAIIENLKDEIGLLHDELAQLSAEIAKAAEKEKQIETLVQINNEDPRCTMKNPPPELAQLLESLNAVNEKLD